MPPIKYAEALEVLGVTQADDADTVRNAYKAMALKYHPDKCTELSNEEATAKFQAIGAAYKVTPPLRACWDCYNARQVRLSNGLAGGTTSTGRRCAIR
jgi:DnaJ-class molecular chaperone